MSIAVEHGRFLLTANTRHDVKLSLITDSGKYSLARLSESGGNS